jgi:hypothetical protein
MGKCAACGQRFGSSGLIYNGDRKAKTGALWGSNARRAEPDWSCLPTVVARGLWAGRRHHVFGIMSAYAAGATRVWRLLFWVRRPDAPAICRELHPALLSGPAASVTAHLCPPPYIQAEPQFACQRIIQHQLFLPPGGHHQRAAGLHGRPCHAPFPAPPPVLFRHGRGEALG